MKMKRCTGCHKEYPESTEFFYYNKQRRHYRPRCKQCTDAQNRAWKENNTERVREAERRRYWEQHDHFLEKNRRYRTANAEKERARTRAYYRENKDKERARNRRWARSSEHRKRYMRGYLKRYRADNAERMQELGRSWAAANPDKVRASRMLRKQRLKNAPGAFSGDDIALMFTQQQGRCWYCQESIAEEYHIEHRVPLARGGSNDPSNLVLACPSCNLSKGARLPHEWSGRLL